jgi:formylglycine-generating enzyme required for sulfatase activity
LEEGKKDKQHQSYYDKVPSELPRHPVKITKPFYLGVYQVTQAEYEKVMGVNPSACTEKQVDASTFKPPLLKIEVKYRLDYGMKMMGKDTSRHPVETVSWDDAIEFCRKLSAMPTEQAARRVYRLPTEAEWEYSCRAGTTARWYSGDDEERLVTAAWFRENSDYLTHRVGEKTPNAWGLYDIQGNVSQWCSDWFSPDYYKQSPTSNPIGPSTGSHRVVRGGSFSYSPSLCRSAYRTFASPAYRVYLIGFRVVVGL